MSFRRYFTKTVMYVILVFFGMLFLLPFIWMLLGAFKKPDAIMTIPPISFPHPVTVVNFKQAFQLAPITRYYFNSLVVSVLSTVGALFSATVVGYGFARLQGRGKNVLFFIALSSMMIPAQVTLFPQYLLYYKIGWVNTYLPLIIPTFLGVSGTTLFIFLMRQFFLSIPKEIEEAAAIDGCSTLSTFFRIMLPLTKPALITVALFEFVFSWNDFFGPLIYLNNSNLYTLPVAVATFSSEFGLELGPLLAMSVLALVPVLILFFIGQRMFVQGIVTTGLKG
ncbi:carbohydrate ABC transporter permease [Alicyclobacillus sp. SO9]|uniref:carbohydrate ABC transporter permease n=1 Tax=Alicyclobacillus sp. SO9 TaxID=2665646 RepID=UPI0018E817EF|nr:carbohydrate ABC transporter permease [Alicyclobacillus sp. SO9]QQE77960.1 carbohydrate ABC transporter permease [Alicyclobacillus sp. SO9]